MIEDDFSKAPSTSHNYNDPENNSLDNQGGNTGESESQKKKGLSNTPPHTTIEDWESHFLKNESISQSLPELVKEKVFLPQENLITGFFIFTGDDDSLTENELKNKKFKKEGILKKGKILNSMMMDERIEPLIPGIMEMVFPKLVHMEELYPND